VAGAGTSEAETIRRIESERLKEFIQRVLIAVVLLSTLLSVVTVSALLVLLSPG